MTVKIRFTYDAVTPESAADGCSADSGWYVPGLGFGRFPVEDETASEHTEMTGREAVKAIRDVVGYVEHAQHDGDSMSVYGSAQTEDYTTDEEVSYCAHLKGDPRLLLAICRAVKS